MNIDNRCRRTDFIAYSNYTSTYHIWLRMGINYGRDLKGIAFVKRPGVTTYTSGGGGGAQASYVINSSKKIYTCI